MAIPPRREYPPPIVSLLNMSSAKSGNAKPNKALTMEVAANAEAANLNESTRYSWIGKLEGKRGSQDRVFETYAVDVQS